MMDWDKVWAVVEAIYDYFKRVFIFFDERAIGLFDKIEEDVENAKGE